MSEAAQWNRNIFHLIQNRQDVEAYVEAVCQGL